MKFNTWLKRKLVIQEVKRGNLLIIFQSINGYSLLEDYIEVIMNNGKEIRLTYENFGYPKETSEEYFLKDFILDHPSSNKPVKKTIYSVIATNYETNQSLMVESKNQGIQKHIKNQWEVSSLLKDEMISYNGKYLKLGGSKGISYYSGKVRFNNIVEYSEYEFVDVLPLEEARKRETRLN